MRRTCRLVCPGRRRCALHPRRAGGRGAGRKRLPGDAPGCIRPLRPWSAPAARQDRYGTRPHRCRRLRARLPADPQSHGRALASEPERPIHRCRKRDGCHRSIRPLPLRGPVPGVVRGAAAAHPPEGASAPAPAAARALRAGQGRAPWQPPARALTGTSLTSFTNSAQIRLIRDLAPTRR